MTAVASRAGAQILEAHADGTFDVALITPGLAGGVDWPADVLARDAHLLAGWPVFHGPESPQARRLRESIPRPPSDLAGAIQESWWDASRSAVVGRMTPVEWVADLLRRMPGAVRVVARPAPTATRSSGGRLVAAGVDGDAEHGEVELMTKGGGSRLARRLRESVEEGTVATKTLGEALEDPVVRAAARERIAELDAARPVLDLRSDGQRRREELHATLVTNNGTAPEARRQSLALREAAAVEPVEPVEDVLARLERLEARRMRKAAR